MKEGEFVYQGDPLVLIDDGSDTPPDLSNDSGSTVAHLEWEDQLLKLSNRRRRQLVRKKVPLSNKLPVNRLINLLINLGASTH